MRQLYVCLPCAAYAFAQALEHPIPLPFDDPALTLECVGVLKLLTPG